MYSLILDSATKVLYVSLLKDKEIIYECYLEGKNDHAKNIVAKVNEALTNNNITTDNLDEVIVGVGPGSYTGVRMAVTVAKMLAVFKKNIKLYKISTLLLMASGYDGIVKAKIDARRNNSFGMIYDKNNLKYIIDEAMISNELLDQNKVDNTATEENYKVDPVFVLEHKEIVLEPNLLIPNYLRDTEAERNLHA